MAPLTIEGYLWACHSLLKRLSSLSCWELSSPLSGAVTAASCSPGWSSQHCSPHHRGSPMSMSLPSEHLSSTFHLRVEFSALQSSVISNLVGWASIAPLTIEGHLWACRSLLGGWVPSQTESGALPFPEIGDRLPCIRASMSAELAGC